MLSFEPNKQHGFVCYILVWMTFESTLPPSNALCIFSHQYLSLVLSLSKSISRIHVLVSRIHVLSLSIMHVYNCFVICLHTHNVYTFFESPCMCYHPWALVLVEDQSILLEIKDILHITTMVVHIHFHKWKPCPSMLNSQVIKLDASKSSRFPNSTNFKGEKKRKKNVKKEQIFV